MTSDEANRYMEQMAGAFKRIGDNLKAMTVLGGVLRGDVPQAMAELSKLPVEHVRELSAAAAMVASLADEELARRG